MSEFVCERAMGEGGLAKWLASDCVGRGGWQRARADAGGCFAFPLSRSLPLAHGLVICMHCSSHGGLWVHHVTASSLNMTALRSLWHRPSLSSWQLSSPSHGRFCPRSPKPATVNPRGFSRVGRRQRSVSDGVLQLGTLPRALVYGCIRKRYGRRQQRGWLHGPSPFPHSDSDGGARIDRLGCICAIRAAP